MYLKRARHYSTDTLRTPPDGSRDGRVSVPNTDIKYLIRKLTRKPVLGISILQYAQSFHCIPGLPVLVSYGRESASLFSYSV